MENFKIARPQPTEYAPYYGTYISLVEGDDIIAALKHQIKVTRELIMSIPDERGGFRYQEGKWTVKEVIGHVVDTERIMAYRALRISRGDATPLAGFDQEPYVGNSIYGDRSLANICREFEAVRQSNVLMFENLSRPAWNRIGTASGAPVSTRGVAYIIAGHELHHFEILRSRYLV